MIQRMIQRSFHGRHDSRITAVCGRVHSGSPPDRPEALWLSMDVVDVVDVVKTTSRPASKRPCQPRRTGQIGRAHV